MLKLLALSLLSSFKLPTSAAMTSTPTSPLELRSKVTGALMAFYVGDALAMPVHWYYDLSQLRRDYGVITKYEAPKVTVFCDERLLKLMGLHMI